VQTDARRPDVFFAIDALEVQGGMEWIGFPQTISLTRAPFDIFAEMLISFPK